MFCLGGDAGAPTITRGTWNRGSNLPAETWELLYRVGPSPFRERVFGTPDFGDHSWDDVEKRRQMGFSRRDPLRAARHAGEPPATSSMAEWVSSFGRSWPSHAQITGERLPIEPWNENIDQARPTRDGRWVREVARLVPSPVVVPAYAAGNELVAPYRAAMEEAYTDPNIHGIALHIREFNLGDLQEFARRYPDKALFVTEFGFEHLADEGERARITAEFLEESIQTPNCAGVHSVTCRPRIPAGRPTSRQARRGVVREGSQMATSAPLPARLGGGGAGWAVDSARLREHVSPAYELANRQRDTLVKVADFLKAASSDSKEMAGSNGRNLVRVRPRRLGKIGAQYPGAMWVPSPNFGGYAHPRELRAIVLHCTEGPRSAVLDWFSKKASQVSAHFLVCKDGAVIQFVSIEEAAWGAGIDFGLGYDAYRSDRRSR